MYLTMAQKKETTKTILLGNMISAKKPRHTLKNALVSPLPSP